jgi:uncharacterized membrane protein YphA (DoxX/SURF4 family)
MGQNNAGLVRSGPTKMRHLGRVLLASQFIYGGYGAARDPGQRPAALEKAGVPGGETLVRLNGVAMLVGGVALALGVKSRAAALGLAASLVPTTIVGHAFWRETDANARRAQTIQLMKNASMLGGLLVKVAAG